MATKQAPAKNKPAASQGRPAGLFTWIVLGLVVIVIAVVVVVKVTQTTPGVITADYQPASPALTGPLTSVPAAIYDQVGITSAIAVTPPTVQHGAPLYTTTSTQGKLPTVLYVGAGYCPFCASQRWSTIMALSRFGTFHHLGITASTADTATFGNIQTFTFYKSSFTSQYINFQGVEEYGANLNAAQTAWQPLMKLGSAAAKVMSTYDSNRTYPFISFGNQAVANGSSVSPSVFAGLTRAEIVNALSAPSNPVTQALVASANYQTAIICQLTHGQPGNVCSSAGVTTAAKALGI